MAVNASNNETTDYENVEVSIPRTVRFWLLIALDTPAAICTFFLLYHLLSKRALRQELHNHVVVVLLVIALSSHLIDIPSYIAFVHLGYVWLSKPWFCNFWSFVSIGLFDMIAILMAYASIERHILIFHSTWVNSTRKRILFHYLPLTLTVLYDVIFYTAVILFPACENTYEYNQPWCGYPCYYDRNILAIYDVVANADLPVLTIILFNIGLIVRHIGQKRRVQRAIQWRRHRKMIVQLISVCCLHLIFYLPSIVLTTAHDSGLPAEVAAELQLYLYFFTYFTSLLLPYVVLFSLPSIWEKFIIIKLIKEKVLKRNITGTVAAQR